MADLSAVNTRWLAFNVLAVRCMAQLALIPMWQTILLGLSGVAGVWIPVARVVVAAHPVEGQ